MPTYDYQCEKCGKRFEVFQSMSAERLTKCQDEACDGTVKRLIGTGAGLLFKGSGFYITDYRSDSYKAGAKSDSSGGGGKAETKKSDSGSSKDTGTKTAAKPSGSGSSQPSA